jgi:plasmid maintenance system killer protein
MKLLYTERLRRSYAEAPESVRKAFDKQCALLRDKLRHPSLHAKKYDESRDVWQARVNMSWRFYFTIQNDSYTIVSLTPHPK